MLSSETKNWLIGLMEAVQERATDENGAVERYIRKSVGIQRSWKLAVEVKRELDGMVTIAAIVPANVGATSVETRWTTKNL